MSRRQAGVIAAAGIVALEKMVGRLADDHARALGEALGAIPGLQVIQAPRSTNILALDVSGLGWQSADLIERWNPSSRVRLVTPRHINAADVEYVVEER